VRNRGILLAVFAAVLLVGLSPLAADPVIKHGIDTFTTTASGKTFYDFADNPIPAGFFCKGSEAFTERVTLRGLPIETEAPGQLHGADTIVERLDDAAFDAHGTAVTRIQIRALSLVSMAPIRTACGSYHAYVTLAGKQRATTMRINRTQENGGNFVAPLAVNARITFIPVKRAQARGAQTRELTTSFTFPAAPIPWSTTGGASPKRVGSVMVDTKGDLRPDSLLSGTSNFWPGWAPGGAPHTKSCTMCEPQTCHDPGTGKLHCTGPTYACAPYNCP
jgi:hypothetical protein